MIVSHAKKATLSVLPVLLVICASVIESKADVVGICNPDGPGQCSATVNITGNILTITLTNTSPPANGGFITAAAFNLTVGTTVNSFTTTNANFALFGASPTGWTGNVAPDGSRTHLFSATSNDYEGGGNPSGGTATGSSVTFTLTLASLNGNTEASVFNSLLIRERGFQPDGSDKDSLLTQVALQLAEPSSAVLLGTALLGAVWALRSRYRKR